MADSQGTESGMVAAEDKDGYLHFLKEMSETEEQINRLKMYNKSFNREMSSKYEGYQIDSDDDTYDVNYEARNDDLDSDTSEGNLSRDEPNEEDKKDTEARALVKAELLQVSPDSPLEGLSRDPEEYNKMLRDIFNHQLEMHR